MAKPSQANRQAQLRTTLGTDELVLARLGALEEINELYRFEVVCYGTDDNINPDDLLGKKASVKLLTEFGGTRYFDGYVSEVRFLGYISEFAQYSLTLVPWFWFLTQAQDCRIFQEMSVPDIFKQVCSDLGFSDIDDRLIGSYEPRDYCVQYRETSHEFLCRLLAEEGIYYFFTHSDGKHELVLADSTAALQVFGDYAEVKYFPPDHPFRDRREAEHIDDWHADRLVRSGKYSQTDYDPLAPNKDLESYSQKQRAHAQSEFEVYDYPGDYTENAMGDSYARRRIEQLQVAHSQVTGGGSVRGLVPGHKFKLKNYDRDDQNIEYTVLWVNQTVSSGDYAGDDSQAAGLDYNCQFGAMPHNEQYRPPRAPPKPIMQGPQTAVVVGPPGEEIWPDQYGRIKVQFHWDRVGGNNEHSSCWIRVAQIWAGKGWGAQFLPRIGHEVVVSFLEGDPDRPLVVASVYNGANKLPYELPDNKTQSGIKSHSSKGGGANDYNEIRFEDKCGEEELLLHAQKDMTTGVENCEAHRVGVDRKKHIGRDEKIKVGRDRETLILKDETLQIEGERAMSVKKNDLNFIDQSRGVTVGGDQAFDVGRSFGVKAKNIVLEAEMSLTLKVGGAFININSAGVFIKGTPFVNINSGGAAGAMTPVSGKRPSLDTSDPEKPKS